ncbi:MAG TPA: PRC-barrel domain-containing protein [Gemmatimonadaceae bacterium]|nr:PRC-barrel domain-containing protein [Gemmatimonadaceae bacterium]
MRADEIRIVPKYDDAAVAPGMLAPLSDLRGFMIADPAPDVRGWKVVLRDGGKVGKVDDLLVDTTRMVVRYLEVKVDRHVILSDEDTWVLVPVEAARFDRRDHVVVLHTLPAAGLAAAPRYQRGVPTPEQERAIRDYYARSAETAAPVRGETLERPPRGEKRR